MKNDPEAEDLLPEYDLDYSKAKPNRFAGQGKGAVTLDDDVLAYLQARADAKGRKLGDLVNELLKREIDLVEALK
ncbi:MAG: hypothetical protein WCA32_01685 [Chromatiaceae bacterium]|jgi:hypothetical protein